MFPYDVGGFCRIRAIAVDVDTVAGAPIKLRAAAPVPVKVNAIRTAIVAIHFAIEMVSRIVVVIFSLNQISASSICHCRFLPSYIPSGSSVFMVKLMQQK